MSNSREYYHPSTSRSSGTHRDEQHLPPIRDVVGDELDRRNFYASSQDVRGLVRPSSAFGESSRGEQRGLTLPPIQQRGPASSNSRSTAYPALVADGSVNPYTSGYPAAAPQRGGHQGNHRRHPSQEQAYAYTGLTPSGSSFIHAAPPAPRGHGIVRQGSLSTQVHNEEPDKRHKCEYCGKGFDRPSSLQVHVRTHTGSQPFTCEWPGCERSFSVRSNMLRHWRSHERSDVSHYATAGQRDGDEDDELEDYSRGKASSSQQNSSNYYTVSRRR